MAARALAAMLVLMSFSASAAIESRDISVAPNVAFVFLDSVTGRMFTVNPGTERFFASASYTVVEPDGTSKTVYLAGAFRARFSEKWRTLAMILQGSNTLVLVDADTLAQHSVATGASDSQPSVVEIAEANGRAYVANSNPLAAQPWLVPGTMSGSLTEVDLGTRATRIAQVDGFQPRHLAVDPAGTSAYVVGVNYMRTGVELEGFLRVFDTANLASGPLTPLGRRPEMMTLSSDGTSLFAVSHMDWTYPPMYAEIGRSIHAALYVVDTATMATRTIVLPGYDDLFMQTGVMLGSMAQGATPGTVYVLDKYGFRMIVVDVASGTWSTVPLESFGATIAYNRVTDNVFVTFPRTGNVGVFSASGDRLDTVPMGSPLMVGDGSSSYNITIDPAGKAYVPHGRDGRVAILAPDTALGPNALVNMTDLWWNPAQGGWGVFVDQQGTTAFAALFVEDAGGRAGWYVMPDGKRQRDGAFAGTLFRTAGPAKQAATNARAVGSMRIAAETSGGSTLTYDIDGRAVSSPIERQRFAAAPRSCEWSVGAAKAALGNANFTSLWFDSKDPGWGLAISHQGDTVFGVIFTYGADNQPTWATMSNGARTAEGSFGGALHRVVPGAGIETVGAMSIGFAGAMQGTLSYSFNGASVNRSIERQVFAPLVTDCASR
jgi:DNA-binding beta-propeller fold protein YncE